MVKVWQQQIEQLRNVSREMAAAIVSEFSSPQLLLEVCIVHTCTHTYLKPTQIPHTPTQPTHLPLSPISHTAPTTSL